MVERKKKLVPGETESDIDRALLEKGYDEDQSAGGPDSESDFTPKPNK